MPDIHLPGIPEHAAPVFREQIRLSLRLFMTNDILMLSDEDEKWHIMALHLLICDTADSRVRCIRCVGCTIQEKLGRPANAFCRCAAVFSETGEWTIGKFAFVACGVAQILHENASSVARQTKIAEFAGAPKGCCSLLSCKAPNARLKCSRCKFARYCNAACQSDHWTSHKRICKSEEVPTASAPSSSNGTPTSNNHDSPVTLLHSTLFANFGLRFVPCLFVMLLLAEPDAISVRWHQLSQMASASKVSFSSTRLVFQVLAAICVMAAAIACARWKK